MMTPVQTKSATIPHLLRISLNVLRGNLVILCCSGMLIDEIREVIGSKWRLVQYDKDVTMMFYIIADADQTFDFTLPVMAACMTEFTNA